jgi:hypothetical protein
LKRFELSSKLFPVQLIAVVCGAIGLFYLFSDIMKHIATFSATLSLDYLKNIDLIFYVLLYLSTLTILILRPIAGLLLYRQRIFGKKLTIYILSADFAIRAVTIINTLTYRLRYPDINNQAAELMATRSVQVHTVSMMPSYLVASISLISVLFLLNLKTYEE